MRLPATDGVPPLPAPDLVRSRNLVGYVRDPQGLYVSLGPGSEARVVPLGTEPPGAALPHVRRAGGRIERFDRSDRRLTLDYDGFGRQTMELGGFDPDQVVMLHGTAISGAPKRLRADAEGRLRFAGVGSGTLEVAW